MYGLIKIAVDAQKKLTDEVYAYLKENYPADCLEWVKTADWSLNKEVPLSDIKMARRPGGARETDKVKGIAEAVKEGKPMEPVVLVKISDGSYKIADGFHRTLGFKHAEKSTIKAYVAKCENDNGPWDKEMHEKKLNVGKKASEEGIGLAKIALMEDDELSDGQKNSLGIASIGGGAYAMNKATPMLDGMERLYHGTSEENAQGIKEKGLLANRAGEGKTTQGANLAKRIGEDQVKGKVYVTNQKPLAAEIAMKESNMNPLDSRLVKFKVPIMDFEKGRIKEVANPELRGMDKDTWTKTIFNELGPLEQINYEMYPGGKDAIFGRAYDALDSPSTRTIAGDLGTEYIPSSKNYRGQNLAGLLEYAQAYPKRFAGGLGLAGLGAAGIGAGLYSLKDNLPLDELDINKQAFEEELGLVKLAAGIAPIMNVGKKMVGGLTGATKKKALKGFNEMKGVSEAADTAKKALPNAQNINAAQEATKNFKDAGKELGRAKRNQFLVRGGVGTTAAGALAYNDFKKNQEKPLDPFEQQQKEQQITLAQQKY